MADLDTAIQRFQDALDKTPADHPNRASRLQDLGAGYGNRYLATGAMGDLDIAIQWFQFFTEGSYTAELFSNNILNPKLNKFSLSYALSHYIETFFISPSRSVISLSPLPSPSIILIISCSLPVI